MKDIVLHEYTGASFMLLTSVCTTNLIG